MSLLNGKYFSDQTRGAVQFPKLDNFRMSLIVCLTDMNKLRSRMVSVIQAIEFCSCLSWYSRSSVLSRCRSNLVTSVFTFCICVYVLEMLIVRHFGTRDLHFRWLERVAVFILMVWLLLAGLDDEIIRPEQVLKLMEKVLIFIYSCSARPIFFKTRTLQGW